MNCQLPVEICSPHPAVLGVQLASDNEICEHTNIVIYYTIPLGTPLEKSAPHNNRGVTVITNT